MADLFELSASLFLDTSQYEDNIGNAKSALSKLFGMVKDGAKQQIDIAVNITTNFVKDVFDTGIELDEVLGSVAALTGKTDDYSKQILRTTVLQEAANSAFTATEIAYGAMYEAMAGNSYTEVLEGLHGLVVGAEAAGEDMKGVSDILTDVTTMYGDTSKEYEHYNDVMAATAANSNTTILKFGQSLKYVGPNAHALGLTIEDTALVIGLLADNGIKAGQAGTMFRNLLARITTNAGQTSKDLGALDIVADKLGVAFYDSYGNMRPFLDFLTESRKAWNGLDSVGKNRIMELIVQTAADATDADEALNQLYDDTNTVKEMLNTLKNIEDPETFDNYRQEVQDFASQYDELLKMLDIPIPDVTNPLSVYKYADALDKARYKLGQMSDEEEAYYGKQIGGLKAMTGWYALMNVEEGKYQDTIDAVYNSEGAAENMRKARMDNIYGDFTYMTAAFDSLKNTIFYELFNPLRPLMRETSSWLNEIREAIDKDGIEGGIRKIGELLKDSDGFLNTFLHDIGVALGHIIGTAINTIQNDLEPAARNLGSAFMSGFLGGASENVDSMGLGLILDWAGKFFKGANEGGTFGLGLGGQVVSGLARFIMPDFDAPEYDTDLKKVADKYSSDLTGALQETPATAYVVPMLDPDYAVVSKDGQLAGLGRTRINVDIAVTEENIQKALDEANAQGDNYLKINGVVFSSDQTAYSIQQYLASAAEEASADAAANYATNFDEASATVGNMVATDLNNAGVDGSADAAAAYAGTMSPASAEVASIVASDIGNSGTDAGNWLADGIQNVLNSWGFTIPITGQITNIIGGNIHQNAVAMNTGRIYRKPTVFGYADGAFQEAGDAGAEAVVGVNSLQSMIAGAVNRAMGQQVVSVPVRDNRPIEITVKLADDTVLARAVHRMYDDEERRQGGNLTRGRA